MSVDTMLGELIAALNANTAETAKNNDLLDRVVAGQKAAIEKIEGGATGVKTRGRPRKEDAAPADEIVETVAGAVASTPAAAPVVVAVTGDELKALAMKTREETKDVDAFNTFLRSIPAHFGVAKFTGEGGITDPDQLRQAAYFIKRWAAGLKVDFSADYDFDEEPVAAAEADEDPLG